MSETLLSLLKILFALAVFTVASSLATATTQTADSSTVVEHTR